MTSRQLHVLISGGGIGGLTAAIALRRAGHQVVIYEKSSLVHEVGQGITLAPSGGRVLQALGLDFAKARMGDLSGQSTRKAETMEMIGAAVDMPQETEQAFGVKMKTAYRIDLHAALLDLACRGDGGGPPVRIVTKSGVAEYDGEQGAFVLETGEVKKADLLIAADGVRSTAGAYINGPEYAELVSSEWIVYRFTLPQERILGDALTAPLMDDGSGMCTVYVNSTQSMWLVRYECRDDGLQNFSFYAQRRYEEAGQQENALRYRTDRQQLLREMAGFHPAIRRVAEMATEVLPLWKCTTREPLPKLHRGKLVVIGDAAHAVKPFLGLGAVSAIEDGGALGVLFQDFPDRGDVDALVEQRVQLFDELRVGRVAAYKHFSDEPVFAAATARQRAECARWTKAEDLPGTHTDLLAWMMGYDVIGEAQRAVAQLGRVHG